MSRSNFCAHCGARLTRKGWRGWLAGPQCNDCALRLGRSVTRPVVIVTAIAAAAFAFGRYLRPPPPPLIIHRAASSPLSDAPVNFNAHSLGSNSVANSNNIQKTNDTDEPVYLCGARTRKGTPCRRRVHAAGERCYQHKGLPAMVPLDKLTIKPDTVKK